MDTTTNDGGSTQVEQPQESAAVTTESHNDDQVITTDSNGTPTMTPVSEAEASTSQSESTSTDAVPEEQQTPTETQAEDKSELKGWLEKKGLEINLDNPNEVKLAEMQLNAEKKMHEATQKSSVQRPELLPESSVTDPVLQQVVQNQNDAKLQMYVRDWFDANPEMKEHREELAKISQARPYLDMDDIRAHFLANPSREAQLKMQGGRDALTNLAQKQSQVPPGASATNTGVYASSNTITPSNVFDLIDKHDQAWFEKNHDAISKAMEGKSS